LAVFQKPFNPTALVTTTKNDSERRLFANKGTSPPKLANDLTIKWLNEEPAQDTTSKRLDYAPIAG
jgi:hypothetical protein